MTVGARSVVTAAEPVFSSILLPLLTELAASRPDPYLLVVDDAHLLTDPTCHLLLQAVAGGVPDGSAVVLLSQDRFPPWLTRTRTAGRLLAIDSDALAFDVDEAAALYAGMGCRLTDAEVGQVRRAHARVGGGVVPRRPGASPPSPRRAAATSCR